VSRCPFSGAPETANVGVMRLDEVVTAVSLILARGRDGADSRCRRDVRPGAFSLSFLPQTVKHHAGLPVVDRSPWKYWFRVP
jgi:hypothetical protein